MATLGPHRLHKYLGLSTVQSENASDRDEQHIDRPDVLDLQFREHVAEIPQMAEPDSIESELENVHSPALLALDVIVEGSDTPDLHALDDPVGATSFMRCIRPSQRARRCDRNDRDLSGLCPPSTKGV